MKTFLLFAAALALLPASAEAGVSAAVQHPTIQVDIVPAQGGSSRGVTGGWGQRWPGDRMRQGQGGGRRGGFCFKLARQYGFPPSECLRMRRRAIASGGGGRGRGRWGGGGRRRGGGL